MKPVQRLLNSLRNYARRPLWMRSSDGLQKWRFTSSACQWDNLRDFSWPLRFRWYRTKSKRMVSTQYVASQPECVFVLHLFSKQTTINLIQYSSTNLRFFNLLTLLSIRTKYFDSSWASHFWFWFPDWIVTCSICDLISVIYYSSFSGLNFQVQ